VIIRRLKQDEGERLRDLRLRALRDAPSAFGSSFGEENLFPQEQWSTLAEQSEAADYGVVFVAIDGSSWLGMAGGYTGQEDSRIASVWGMWVDPPSRRRGVGRQLLQAVIDWAMERGAISAVLSVSDRAPQAAALYRELGFTPTGQSGHLRSDPSIEETVMARTIQGPSSGQAHEAL
jgi:ribosomal protein S18 acetylase RimI-like enzyme